VALEQIVLAFALFSVPWVVFETMGWFKLYPQFVEQFTKGGVCKIHGGPERAQLGGI